MSRIGRRGRVREEKFHGGVFFFASLIAFDAGRKKKILRRKSIFRLVEGKLEEENVVETGGRGWEGKMRAGRTERNKEENKSRACLYRSLHAAIIRKVHLTRNERNRTRPPALLYRLTAFHEGQTISMCYSRV